MEGGVNGKIHTGGMKCNNPQGKFLLQKYKTTQNVGWSRANQKINLVPQRWTYYYGCGDPQDNIMNKCIREKIGITSNV